MLETRTQDEDEEDWEVVLARVLVGPRLSLSGSVSFVFESVESSALFKPLEDTSGISSSVTRRNSDAFIGSCAETASGMFKYCSEIDD